MKIQLDVNLEECSNAFLTDVCLHTDNPAVLEEIARFIRDNPEHAWNKVKKYGEGELWGASLAITENKLANQRAFEYLCHCPDSTVRQTVSESSEISKEVMNFLADDESWEVIMALIDNPALDKDTFDHIVDRVLSDGLKVNWSDAYDYKALIAKILEHKYISKKQQTIVSSRCWREIEL